MMFPKSAGKQAPGNTHITKWCQSVVDLGQLYPTMHLMSWRYCVCLLSSKASEYVTQIYYLKLIRLIVNTNFDINVDMSKEQKR